MVLKFDGDWFWCVSLAIEVIADYVNNVDCATSAQKLDARSLFMRNRLSAVTEVYFLGETRSC
jgi:hypothetical protein